MKFLITGDGHSDIHERAYCHALRKLGHEVHMLAWYEHFNRFQYDNISPWRKLNLRLQNKYIIGHVIKKINLDLLRIADALRPDVIFIYHGTHIWPKTILSLKKKGFFIIGYNNDDPFSPHASFSLWRHYLRSIPHYDIHFVYRQHNIAEYLRAGAKNVYLLRSYYIPEKNYPVILNQDERMLYESDVLFVGHFEDDGRKEYLEEIIKQGYQLRLYGTEWNPAIKRSKYLSLFYPVKAIRDEQYNKAICGAKIALCFLSKLNRDNYTRRCFEITASRTFLLSEYSDELAELFQEGKEAEYFRDKKDLIRKIEFYLKNHDKRASIATAGCHRVNADRHDLYSRMEHLLEVISGHLSKEAIPPLR